MLSVALLSVLRPRGRRGAIPVGILVLFVFAASSGCSHAQDSRLQYLANEGVAVFHEETTLLFDPLFRTDYGIYTLVPEKVREAMFSGSAPFEKITAVFVSHYHDDHFDPGDMLTLLRNHAQTRLYAPRQAIDAMRTVAATSDKAVFDRTVAIDLAYKDEPQSFRHAGILVEAFFVPHAGWPVRRIVRPPASSTSISTSAPKWRNMNSLWSRVAAASRTTVTPGAFRPAKRTADFTWAEATGGV